MGAQTSNRNTFGQVRKSPEGYTINSGESITVIAGTANRLGDGQRLWVEENFYSWESQSVTKF